MGSRETEIPTQRSSSWISTRSEAASGAWPTLSAERRRRFEKGGYPIRSRSVWLTACSVLALAACGGEKAVEQPRIVRPRIERPLAEALAARSDAVATLLDRGDACGAKDEAAALRRELTSAINNRRIPVVYLEDLSATVNEIEAQIVCREPQLPPPPREDDDGHKGKKKGKGKGHHGDDD